MRFTSFIGLVAILMLLSASCRSTKNIQKAIEKKDTVVVIPNVAEPTHEDTMRMIGEVFQSFKPITYNTFSAKIKVDYFTSKGKQPDFIANVRMQRDSIIWISISNDIGIEGFRVLINKDSIRVMDKLANTYQVKPLSSIQDIVQIPFSFNDVQELLVGNPIFFNRDSIIAYSKTDKGYSLLSVGTIFRNLLSINNQFQLDKSKLDDADLVRNRTADMAYYEYETKTGVLFSTYRELFLSQQNKMDIQLKFKDYKFNEEMNYPFTVPKKFKRIQ
ncbi:MAG: DUF4292 domain-containing protein [Chitinophagaceae bacterium]|nr:DUF4292 domain-containing protein [Chitinophagaceae bacterium]